MKKVFILNFSFILNPKVKDLDILSCAHCKFVIFKREGDFKLVSDGVSDKFVMVKLQIIFTETSSLFLINVEITLLNEFIY